METNRNEKYFYMKVSEPTEENLQSSNETAKSSENHELKPIVLKDINKK